MSCHTFKTGFLILICLLLTGFFVVELAQSKSSNDFDRFQNISSKSAINYPLMRTLVCSQVWQHIKPRLAPPQPHQPHLMIAFSGIPGTGLSNCARACAKLLQGSILSSNELRHTIRYLGFNPQECDRLNISWIQYVTAYCLDQLATGGYGIIILDKTIDRTYALASRWCSLYGWKLKVIRLEYESKEACLDLLSYHHFNDQYRLFFDRWWKDYIDFKGPYDLNLTPIHPSQELPDPIKNLLLKWLSEEEDPSCQAIEFFSPAWLAPSEIQTSPLHTSINLAPHNAYL